METENNIEYIGTAEITEEVPTKDIYSAPDHDPMEGKLEEEIASCSNGHIRRKTVNGVCYCQMCCGGQWLYWYQIVNGKRVYHKCGNSPWTVSCGGNNYILSC